MGSHVLESVSKQRLKCVGRGLSANLFTAYSGADSVSRSSFGPRIHACVIIFYDRAYYFLSLR